MVLRECPDEYYNNCSNAGKRCSTCRAMVGGSKLHYNPISPDLHTHPAEAKDHKARATNKRGHQSEKKAKQGLQRSLQRELLVRSTIASGAKLQDGDLEIPTSNFTAEKISVECKDRGLTNRWHLTREEYQHGVKHGVEAFAITRTDPDTRRNETIYMVTAELFARLVADHMLQQDQD